MPHIAHTTHKIVDINFDLMKVLDTQYGSEVATATRGGDGNWTIHIDGYDDVTAENRADAISALKDGVLESIPGTFATFMIPFGLANAP